MNTVKLFRAVVGPARRIPMMLGQARPMTAKAGQEIKYAPVSPKLRRLQEHFQMDNGALVHLKGGAKDRYLYLLTILLTSYGFCYCLYIVYQLAYPRPPKQ